VSHDESSGADIGIVGLGVMGSNLARNFHSRGLTVAVYNRERDMLDDFMAEFGDERFIACADYAALAAALKPPRRVVMMVTAGRAVDAVLDALVPHLEAGDIAVDGGNSNFVDTDRRNARAASEGWRFVGMGVSGGEEGALKGPAMMPGGDREAWEALQPLLESACAVSDSGPCVDWCGRGSAGHFVKMVHNGIEYGDMQLIAEVHSLMRRGLGMAPPAIREVFEGWNRGPLESFLIEITAGIVAAKDPSGEGPLLEQILDVAGQKGTGRWTAIGAIELGVPLPTITAAVDGRALSALKSARLEAAAAFPSAGSPLTGVSVDDLESALYAAKIMSYTQGFALLAEASEVRDYGTDLAAISRIWKAGCIIRARFLDRVYSAFRARPDLPLLMLDESFAGELRARLPAWRRVVAQAALAGITTPALSASLSYFDTVITGRGTASLIQAQRDWFGAHTYRRFEAPEAPVHSDWDALEQL